MSERGNRFDRPGNEAPPPEHTYGEHREPKMFGKERTQPPRTEFHERNEAELKKGLQPILEAHRGTTALGKEAFRYLLQTEFASDYISVGTSPDNQHLSVTIRTREQGDLKVEL